MKNSFLALILIAATMPFISCTATDDGTGRNTIFHRTEESPRSESSDKRPRYGSGGTHSPREASTASTSKPTKKKRSTRTSRPTRKKRTTTPSDPNGIVKPRDLEPDDEPEIVKRKTTPKEEDTPPVVKKKDPTPTPPASTSTPYAEAVPGKYGLVYSPYKKGALVNVTDDNDVPLPPGTEVTDPHTGKVFRVP